MSDRKISRLLAVIVLTAGLGLLAGCASQRSCSTGIEFKGTVLEYRVPEGASMTYAFTNHMDQKMEVQGQSVPVESTQAMTFTMTGTGVSEGGYTVDVTVNELSVTASSPQGSVEADVAEVLGKSFSMRLSRLGVESDLPESESLQFIMEPDGPRSVIPGFEIMFPDVTGQPLEIGDAWPTSIFVTEPTGNGVATIQLETVNTFEGFETVGGRECARITAVFEGSISGTGTQQGMPWALSAELAGTGVWFFDHADGVYVRDENVGVATGDITVETPNGDMVLPITRDFTITTELLE